MKVEKLVTSLLMSEMLLKTGIKMHGAFGYYKNSFGEVYVDFINPDKDLFIQAYTSEELLQALPSDIIINENHYILVPALENSFKKDYKKYVFDQEEGTPLAELQTLKTAGDESVCRYWFNGVIATSINKDGEYVNLICFGATETESRAKMILLLNSENLL